MERGKKGEERMDRGSLRMAVFQLALYTGLQRNSEVRQ